MKKIFLITALLAIGSLSLAGCGAQSNNKQTQEETARISITAEDPATTENDNDGGSTATDNEDKNCPDGNCPEKKCRKDRHEGMLPDGILFRVHEFYIANPEFGHFKEIMTAPNGEDSESTENEENINKSESNIKRDARPPRSRMPKKNSDTSIQLPITGTKPEN